MTTTRTAVAAPAEAMPGSDEDAGASRPADEPPSTTTVEVRDEAGLAPSDAEWLRGRLVEACDALIAGGELKTGGEARVRVVGDEAMAHEHERSMGAAGTTDVITFDLSEDGALDADLLVCLDEARRRAHERGHGVRRELLLYALHGVLHCSGYNDTDEDSYARMHAREDEVLRAIGVGATFDDGFGAGGEGTR